MTETKTTKKLDRSDLVAAVGITHDGVDVRIEAGGKIPAKIPDNEVQTLQNQGAIVTKDEYAEIQAAAESEED